MNTLEIYHCLGQLMKRKKGQYGVIPADYLEHIKIKSYPLALVVNNESSAYDGEHWVAIFIKRKSSELEFFCSYGKPISFYSKYFTQFMLRVGSNSIENRIRVQGPFSRTCGEMTLLFLYKRLKQCPMSSIYCVLSKDFEKNDRIVKSFVRKLFKSKFIGKNHKGIQCCKCEMDNKS